MRHRLACALALLAGSVVVHAGSTPAQPARPPPPIAPAWTLQTPQGETVRFPQDAQARPTVLMFWPSWCPFSRALQPYVQDLWQDYRAAGVDVWTINIKEDRDPVQVLRERGLSLPLLVKGDAVANAYGLQYTPWLVVIDGEQRIVYTRPPNPPSPVATAQEVRAVLNGLLGARAVPLPQSYPKPYDLHLKDKSQLNRQLVPKPVETAVWQAWVLEYLAGIAPDARVPGVAAGGAIGDGKTAIARARAVWAQLYGEEVAQQWAPYRAYRRNDWWVVLGDGPDGVLGGGLIAVFDAQTGAVTRVERERK